MAMLSRNPVPLSLYMDNSTMALNYRKRVCGYCAAEMRIYAVSMFNVADPAGDAEYAHCDEDGGMYPCLAADEFITATMDKGNWPLKYEHSFMNPFF